MLNIGPPELILIFVIALVIVGPQRLPELGRTVGKALREFRKMQGEVKDLVNTGMGDEFKEATAELRRTASDLKEATDVRSAFREQGTPARRPHGSARRDETDEGAAATGAAATGAAATGAAASPDTGGSRPSSAPDAPGAGLGAPSGQDGASAPSSAPPVESGDTGNDA